MSTPTRHLKWAGQNERAAEHARLVKKVEQAERMAANYPDHTSQVSLALAVEALVRFEDGEA